MKQEKGLIRISGNADKYNSEIFKIQDNTKFTIVSNTFNANLDGFGKGDTAHIDILVGHNGYFIDRNYTRDSYVQVSFKGFNSAYKSSFSKIQPAKLQTTWNASKAHLYGVLTVEVDDIIPSVENISVSTNNPRAPIMVSWDSTYQDRFELVASVDGEVVYSTKGNTEKVVVIPKNTFQSGVAAELSVKVISNDKEGFSYIRSANATETKRIEAQIPSITLTEFMVSNYEASWRGTNLDGAIGHIEVWNKDFNNSIALQIDIPETDFIQGRYSIPTDNLYDGNHRIKLTVSKNIDGDIYTTTRETEILVQNRPYVSINSLEPANVPRNYEKDIKITWITTNQKTYNLQVYQEGVLKKDINGLTQTEYTLPANTLKDGSANIKLTVTNTIYGVIKQVSKTVQFTLYGGVKPPIITTDASGDILSKDGITISWNPTDMQEYYRVEYEVVRIYNSQLLDTRINLDSGYFLDGDSLSIKEDSGIIRGKETSYKGKTTLFKNDTIRNIKVTIYNALKDSNSNVYDGDIYVIYDIDVNTSIASCTQNDAIVINSTSDTPNLTHRLMRGTDDVYTNYKEIYVTTQKDFVYVDTNVKSNTRYYYYVISSDGNKSIASNVVTEQISIKGFIFTDLDTKEFINLNLEVDADFDTIDGKAVVEYLGKKTADIEQDQRLYQQGSYSCIVKVADLASIDRLFNAQKVAYRDSQGNAFICGLMGKKVSYKDRLPGYVRLSFTMVENDSLKLFE